MATFTYNSPSIQSFEAIYNALIFHGVTDAGITLNGNLTITTSVGSQAQCDSAVNDATKGNLFANKSSKIDEINAKTKQLVNTGADDWAGNKVELSKARADDYFTDYEYFTSEPAKLTVDSPYIVFRLDGRSSSTADVNDIKTLADNAIDRLSYLYTNTSNGDGSKGEVALIQDVLACTSQLELDAVTDDRD